MATTTESRIPFTKLPPNEKYGPEMWTFGIDKSSIPPKSSCNRIYDFLYLGESMAAENQDWLREMKITCVINIRREKVKTRLDRIDYFDIAAYDDDYEIIHLFFDVAIEKIERHRRIGGRILLNCEMGMSRSATICLMYIVRYKNVTLRKAYFELKRKRPCIRPNLNLWNQMIGTEGKWRGRKSVAVVRAGWELLPDVYLRGEECDTR